jgi:hypothetical protein
LRELWVFSKAWFILFSVSWFQLINKELKFVAAEWRVLTCPSNIWWRSPGNAVSS